MGLKTKNYKIERTGITVPTAYAQIDGAHVELDGTAIYRVAIQTEREKIGKLMELDSYNYRVAIDKGLPMHEQLYRHLKEQDQFKGWEDDIVAEV